MPKKEKESRKDESPFEAFSNLVKTVVSVPKKEINRLEKAEKAIKSTKT